MTKATATKAKKTSTKTSRARSGTRKAGDEQKLTRLIEDIIEQGATTAEDINRAVLALPVSVLESLGLQDTAAEVKRVQDTSIGAIYKLIHDINHRVADLATDLLDQRKTHKKQR
ncbi:MAG: hypothetical protein R3E50_15495 [Halioglobus sp.]